MTRFSHRAGIALAAAVLLSACGGGVTYSADEHASSAALMTPVNTPQPDCAADGCNTPRIVDGLAEQFRAAAIEAPPAAAEPLSQGRGAGPAADAPQQAQ